MSSRLDHIPGNQLVARISQLKTDIETLRTAQRVSGSSGTLNYKSANTSTWDLNETVGTTSDTSTHRVVVTVTFTSDGTQQFPNAECMLDLFIGSPIEANRLSAQSNQVSGVFMYINPLYQQNPIEGYIQTNPATFTNPLVYTWIAGFINSTIGLPFTYYLKANIVGSCPGTISVTRTIS